MSYATIEDVFKRYSPVHTLVGSADNMVASEYVSSVFINDAESLIDGYISHRYEVPISPVPALITQAAADIALFNMLVEKLPQVPDFFQPRFDRAINNLEMIRDGDLNITSATVITAGDQEAWSSTIDYHPIFDPTLDDVDQAVDADQVAAAKDERADDSGH